MDDENEMGFKYYTDQKCDDFLEIWQKSPFASALWWCKACDCIFDICNSDLWYPLYYPLGDKRSITFNLIRKNETECSVKIVIKNQTDPFGIQVRVVSEDCIYDPEDDETYRILNEEDSLKHGDRILFVQRKKTKAIGARHPEFNEFLKFWTFWCMKQASNEQLNGGASAASANRSAVAASAEEQEQEIVRIVLQTAAEVKAASAEEQDEEIVRMVLQTATEVQAASKQQGCSSTQQAKKAKKSKRKKQKRLEKRLQREQAKNKAVAALEKQESIASNDVLYCLHDYTEEIEHAKKLACEKCQQLMQLKLVEGFFVFSCQNSDCTQKGQEFINDKRHQFLTDMVEQGHLKI